jgi:hypothetical protein
MMRQRTRRTYEAFWTFVYHAFDEPSAVSPDPELQKMVSDVMVYFWVAKYRSVHAIYSDCRNIRST